MLQIHKIFLNSPSLDMFRYEQSTIFNQNGEAFLFTITDLMHTSGEVLQYWVMKILTY